MRDFYDNVTARIIAQLEQGVVPWKRPWATSRKNGVGLLPVNAFTGRSYSGMNIMLLWDVCDTRGYPTKGFMTYQQAQQAQAFVRKGEKATTVMFTKWVDDEENGKQRPVVKLYSVFNLAQLDNLHPSYGAEPEPVPEDVQQDTAFSYLKACGATIQHGGDKACYIPKLDVLRLPPFSAFVSRDDYFSTALHEATHATGAETRLQRTFGKRFGDSAYAAEELVAELGSAFMCAKLGIQPTSDHASYLDGWLKVLKGDSRAIFTAASMASQACEYIYQNAGEEQRNDQTQGQAA